jgi:MerR family transcriptional regulator, light-induced transcriptional regulator
MGPFLTHFQIRDLEEFSGVKAHTIRMWEKRYGLLEPERSDTNIRFYGLEQLKTILNVSYLNQHGLKISVIAAMSPEERELKVQELAGQQGTGGDVLNTLKMAMLAFDELLFMRTSKAYSDRHGFRALVEEVYVPLLENIGVLWQTNAICPAQEHFVSNIIRHELIVATHALAPASATKRTTHVLYLPADEIHELGLLYLNHVIRNKGERTIYLGQSVPMEDLRQVAALHSGPLVFITVLMANPSPADVPAYLLKLRAMIPDERVSFWVTGSQLARVAPMDVPPGMNLFKSMRDVIAALDGSN